MLLSWLLPTLLLYLMTSVAAHLVMSFGQTLMHYKLGHHPMGGKFFHNPSTSTTPIIPKIISSQRPTSVTKATIRPSSSFPYFW
jgi:hypothetical protein